MNNGTLTFTSMQGPVTLLNDTMTISFKEQNGIKRLVLE